MSANAESFFRPKVRFCQTDVDKQNELKNGASQNSSGRSNKPRIRSIITLDKPVILLKPNKAFSNTDCKETKSELSGCDNAILSCVGETASTSLTDASCKTGNQRSASDVDNTERAEVYTEETDKPKKSNNVPASREKRLDKVLKSQNAVKTDTKRRDCTRDKKGKENDALSAKNGSNGISRKSLDSKVSQCTLKPSQNNISSKKVTMTKPSCASLTSKKVKQPMVTVMPCYKHNKVTSKTKISPVKKTMVRDVVGPKIKPYIGPGVPRKKQDTPKTAKIEDQARMNSCTSGEKLARPEYNSIMCTINKLNDTKKQKFTVDLEHLPPTYKSLINGKIASALDFPLDEAIYKNLVDLSIDEKQLPSRLKRSKDPEPRQRDIVPVLSNFFVPESTEEYCTPVSIKTMAAEAVDSWSAFRISDKIFEWKHSLDHI